MKLILDYGDIDIDDVTIFQFFIAGNAMTDHVVDRSANRSREAAIIQRGRYGVKIADDIGVANLVQFPGVMPRLTCGAIMSSTWQARRPATRIRSISSGDLKVMDT